MQTDADREGRAGLTDWNAERNTDGNAVDKGGNDRDRLVSLGCRPEP